MSPIPEFKIYTRAEVEAMSESEKVEHILRLQEVVLHLVGVGLNGFAVVAFRAGGGLGHEIGVYGYPPRTAARMVRAGDLKPRLPYRLSQHPWRIRRCRTGLEINSCGTCK